MFTLADENLFRRFTKWFRLSGALLGLYIIIMLFVSGSYIQLDNNFLVGENRMWGERYIPGWPNVIPLSLVFCLWLEQKSKDSRWYVSLLLVVASFLTTSRIGIFGSLLVLFYFMYQKLRTQSIAVKVSVGLFVLLISLIGLIALIANQYLLIRMFYFGDRIALWKIALQAIAKRPFWVMEEILWMSIRVFPRLKRV